MPETENILETMTAEQMEKLRKAMSDVIAAIRPALLEIEEVVQLKSRLKSVGGA